MTILGRFTDGVDELDLHGRESVSDLLQNLLRLADAMGRLTHDADSRSALELRQIIDTADDGVLIQIPDNPPHLDMVRLADHYRMPSLRDQSPDRLMDPEHQRTCGIVDDMAPVTQFLLEARWRSVRCDHDVAGLYLIVDGIHHLDPRLMQFLDGLGIVDQLADDGQIGRDRGGECGIDSISDSKACPQGTRAGDPHDQTSSISYWKPPFYPQASAPSSRSTASSTRCFGCILWPDRVPSGLD